MYINENFTNPSLLKKQSTNLKALKHFWNLLSSQLALMWTGFEHSNNILGL